MLRNFVENTNEFKRNIIIVCHLPLFLFIDLKVDNCLNSLQNTKRHLVVMGIYALVLVHFLYSNITQS